MKIQSVEEIPDTRVRYFLKTTTGKTPLTYTYTKAKIPKIEPKDLCGEFQVLGVFPALKVRTFEWYNVHLVETENGLRLVPKLERRDVFYSTPQGIDLFERDAIFQEALKQRRYIRFDMAEEKEIFWKNYLKIKRSVCMEINLPKRPSYRRLR
jgi:hypothetical protein